MKSTSVLNSESQRLLEKAFGAQWQEAWLCWKSNMAGKRVRDLAIDDLPAGEDHYFCVASLSEGATTRTNENALDVHVLVVDDVGTKIDKEAFEMFAPEPSYWLESSPGNFQVGYVIPDGIDADDYKALRLAMKANPIWGHADGIDPVHLFRLPQGVNTKPAAMGWEPVLGKTGRLWKGELLIEEFGGLVSATWGPGVVDTDLITGLEALQRIVQMIPNTEQADYNFWASMGHALWGATEGSSDGFEVFDAWSNAWPLGGDSRRNETFWDSIQGSHIGRGWLKREAGKHDPAGVEAWATVEARDLFDDGEDTVAEARGGALASMAVDPMQRTVALDVFRRHHDILRFNHDSGCWHQFLRGINPIWEPLPKSMKMGFQEAEKWVGQHGHALRPVDLKAVSKSNFYDGVESILRQKLTIQQKHFDCDPWLLGTPGGTVWLGKGGGALRWTRPADFISKSTRVAPAEREDCPRWLKFIGEVCEGDAAAALFLKQWFGYCLTGDVSEQVFLFLYGPGGNGKSVLVDTVAWVMGTYFRKPVDDLYVKKQGVRHKQEEAMLAGARMISVSEVPVGASWDEAKLKRHTDGTEIAANFMRENTFEFFPQFKLTVLGNHQPSFPGGMDPAIRRRFRMMPMNFVPKVVDRKLSETLKGEAPGILRWLINGLCDPKVGWHEVGFMVPSVMTAATDEYAEDQDILAGWIADRTEDKAGALIASQPLYRDWIEYRNAQGEVTELYSSVHSLVKELERRGWQRVRTNAARGFRNKILKTKVNSPFND